MKELFTIFYLALSSLLTITLKELGAPMNSRKFWIIMGCFIGAYLCGIATTLGG